jgi:hypothetical protein
MSGALAARRGPEMALSATLTANISSPLTNLDEKTSPLEAH